MHGSQFPNQVVNPPPCSGCSDSEPLDHQRRPLMHLLLALFHLTLHCTRDFQVPSHLELGKQTAASFHCIALNKYFKLSLPPSNFIVDETTFHPFSILQKIVSLSHHCCSYILNHFNSLLFYWKLNDLKKNVDNPLIRQYHFQKTNYFDNGLYACQCSYFTKNENNPSD